MSRMETEFEARKAEAARDEWEMPEPDRVSGMPESREAEAAQDDRKLPEPERRSEIPESREQEAAPGMPRPEEMMEKMRKDRNSGRYSGGKAAEGTETMSLRIDSLSRNEPFARVVVAVFASRLDPTLEEIDDLKTAVSEAVTNSVIHGYRGGSGPIYIDASVLGQELTVTVRDEGVGIPDIKQAMEPMFTTDPAGERSGMGFAFMEAFMDQVEVWSEVGKGTAVTMKKRMGG